MPIIQDISRYQELLGEADFFKDFEKEELRTLIEACDRKTLAPREALWAVGTKGDAAYILVEGRLEQVRRLPPDGTRIDQHDEPGTVIGLSYVVKGWKHQSSATALERTEFLKLERAKFQKMFDTGEMAAYRLVDQLAEDLVQEMRDANRRLHEVFGNPAETLRTLRRRVRQG